MKACRLCSRHAAEFKIIVLIPVGGSTKSVEIEVCNICRNLILRPNPYLSKEN